MNAASNLAIALVQALDDHALDLLAERLAPRLAQPLVADNGYLDVAGAAEFLACPVSRIYALVSVRRIPHERDGSRLLFDGAELREYVRRGGRDGREVRLFGERPAHIVAHPLPVVRKQPVITGDLGGSLHSL